MTRKGEIVAIVPVRAGSQRVLQKSVRKFGDTNLLALKIETLRQVRKIDRIVVTSDSDFILELARALGASTHKREKYYASDVCSGSEFFENLARSIDGTHFLYSPPTSPLVRPESITKAINEYIKMDAAYDSLASASPVKDHMWLDGSPLNYSLIESPNSQDLPEILKITYGINLISRLDVSRNRNVVGQNPKFFHLDEKESVDIDTMMDFQFAEYLYEQGALENV